MTGDALVMLDEASELFRRHYAVSRRAGFTDHGRQFVLLVLPPLEDHVKTRRLQHDQVVHQAIQRLVIPADRLVHVTPPGPVGVFTRLQVIDGCCQRRLGLCVDRKAPAFQHDDIQWCLHRRPQLMRLPVVDRLVETRDGNSALPFQGIDDVHGQANIVGARNTPCRQQRMHHCGKFLPFIMGQVKIVDGQVDAAQAKHGVHEADQQCRQRRLAAALAAADADDKCAFMGRHTGQDVVKDRHEPLLNGPGVISRQLFLADEGIDDGK